MPSFITAIGLALAIWGKVPAYGLIIASFGIYWLVRINLENSKLEEDARRAERVNSQFRRAEHDYQQLSLCTVCGLIGTGEHQGTTVRQFWCSSLNLSEDSKHFEDLKQYVRVAVYDRWTD